MRWKVFFTVLFCATLLISQSVKAQDDDDSVTNADDEIVNNDDYDVDTDVETDVVDDTVDTAPEPDAEEVISDDIVPEEEVKDEEEIIAETESLEQVNDVVLASDNSEVLVSRMSPNVQPSSRSGNYADGLWLDNLDIGGNDANYNWGKFFFFSYPIKKSFKKSFQFCF